MPRDSDWPRRFLSLFSASLFFSSLFLSLISLPSIHSRSIINGEHVVHTSLGTIRGVSQKFNGISIGAYLGIPYARPPVGSRRFLKPEIIERWAGELQAQVAGKTCFLTIDTYFPQFPGAEMWNPPNGLTEDCLNMNIWVPEQHDGTVLVWIYGGGFYSGSPSLDLYDGIVLAAEHNSIVVNINYRLGPFGFLYLGEDSPVTGNMGLLDQQLALRWIHENIGSFGGDPKRVTLFGESAGAASVTSHLIAPGSSRYFSKVIAKSGAIINSWATRSKESMLESSLQLARNLNCSHGRAGRGDIHAIARCLQSLPSHVIQTEADNVSVRIGLPMTFAFVPVDEDPLFFQGNVFEKIRRREMKKDVSAIVGSVKDEGTFWLPYFLGGEKYGFHFNHTISAEDPHNQALINRDQYRRSLEAFLPYFGNSQLVRNAMMHAYQDVSDKSSDRERFRDGVARFLGDYFFTCGLVEFADILVDQIYGPVYMYYFTMRSSANPWPSWMGAMHGYEIEYAFGLPLRRPQLYRPDRLPLEQQFSRKIMHLWTTFASTGSPASYWPKYNRIERKSLELNEELVSGGYRIDIDVHGAFCRLIDEGKSVLGQMRNCVRDRSSNAGSEHGSSGWSTLLLLSAASLLSFDFFHRVY